MLRLFAIRLGFLHMTSNRQVIEADLTFSEGRFQRGWQIAIEVDGTIAQIGALGLPPTRRLTGRALLPGMVNVHSHAFQRGLRGRGETFPAGVGDFWSWREAMYALVESLDEGTFRQYCTQAFSEMLAAGITCVGEFHYLHHGPSCAGYDYDDLVLEEADRVGIRICLLCSYYRTGGIGQPLAGGQRRFSTPSVDSFLEQVETLQGHLRSPFQSLGLAPHSVRALARDELKPLAQYAARHRQPIHMHIEEQPREIEECLAAYGARPMEVILGEMDSASRLTAIHCTHSTGPDLVRLAQAGAMVCACPLTEGNLGDGLSLAPDFVEAGGRLCLGTDSNLRIDPAEDMRWLEYAQRLRSGRRGVFRGPEGTNSRELLATATTHGAVSLGLSVGRLAPGCGADFFALDLAHPTLAGCTHETLLDAYVFGSGREVVREVCVGGRWVRE